MTDQPTSRNRWEPASAGPPAGPVPAGQPAHGVVVYPLDPPADGGHGTAPIPRPARRAGRRVRLAGTVAVLLIGGGAGGYLIGHVAAAEGVQAPGTGTVNPSRPGPGVPDPDDREEFGPRDGFRSDDGDSRPDDDSQGSTGDSQGQSTGTSAGGPA